MIDIHCHILPGVDDGAASLTESLAMARAAEKEGIQKIIATPHHQNGAFVNPASNIIGVVDYLNGKLEQERIAVEILPGQETRIYKNMLADLKKGDVLPLNETSGYVFIELPENHIPNYATQLLFDMQIAGYKPIIVHPERNQELMENPDKLYRFVKNGALTQVTAASVIGKAGKRIEKFMRQMLEANLTHFIASDAHNAKKRGFYMRAAFREIKKEYGSTFVYQLMENSEALVNGQIVQIDAPERVSSKRIWGLFKR